MIEEYVDNRLKKTYVIKFIHSRFSEEIKRNVVNDHGEQRNIIISTTICETSLTIPSLSYVVDSCLCKLRVDNNTFVTTFCSYQALLQRSGRVGRCGPGVYIPCINSEFLEQIPEQY